MAIIYKPPYLTLASLHLRAFVLLPPLPLAFTLHPSLPFIPPLSLSFLGDVNDDAFLDCLHKYRRLLFIGHFLRRITATAHRSELE